MTALKDTRLSPEEMQAFFDKETWAEWLGLANDSKPFTVGLRLSEPPDGEGPWALDVVLRSKKDEDIVETYTAKRLPRGWNKYRDEIDQVLTRWLKVVPWLAEDGSLNASYRSLRRGSF